MTQYKMKRKNHQTNKIIGIIEIVVDSTSEIKC